MTNFYRKVSWHCCCLVALLFLSQDVYAGMALVVSAKSSLKTLDKEVVRELFLGNISTLPDGMAAILVDQPASSPLRNEFYLRVAHRSAAQVAARWARMYFTGRGIPPREGEGSADIKRFLHETPNSVGYIDEADLDPSVRAVYVFR